MHSSDGTVYFNRAKTQNTNLWKASQRRRVKTHLQFNALQQARKRVLTSDLPSLAIQDLIAQIDADENAHQSPQQTIDITQPNLHNPEILTLD